MIVSWHRVGIVVFDGYQGLDVVGPWEVFRGADDALALSGSDHRYETVLVGDPASRSETRLGIGPVVRPGDAGRIDTLVLPGGRGVREAAEHPELVADVRRMAAGATRVASVCTGAFLLAAADLAGERPVATHWAYADELRRSFPGLVVDGESIHRCDDSIWSSAGVTAGLDLTLALVEADHGAELAHLVACWFVVFPRRPGGQRQFARAVDAPPSAHPGVAAAREHVERHLADDLRVEALAEAAAMSPRHFSRVFRSEVGLAPAAYVQQRRLEVARDLLEQTTGSLDVVARRCGLGSAETLRRVMARHVGVSPEAYRRRFARTTPSADHEEPPC